MEKRKILILSISIVIMLVITTATSTIGLILNGDLNNTNFNEDPYPQLDAYKKVWNETSGNWESKITVEKGTIVRFNITLVYHDLNEYDSCYKATYIYINDSLGDFEYIGNPTCSDVSNPDNYLTVDPINNIYSWYFGTIVNLAEVIAGYDNVLYLEFDVKANKTGTLLNQVHVDAKEKCCNIDCEAEAQASVRVTEIPNPDIELKKYVKNQGQWEKYTQIKLGETAEFKIIINNTGNTNLNQVHVEDDLPTYLTYNYDANPTHTTATDQHIEWNLGTLTPTQTQQITFTATANQAGTQQCNYAIVTTQEGPTDDDTACVDIPPNPDIELKKYVKNQGQWEKYTQIKLGETAEFKIIINNTGNTNLNQVHVEDDLPTYLTYNYDANPTHTTATDQHIEWNLGTLTPTQTQQITFTATANQAGTQQCNYAIVTTQEGPTDDDTACIDVKEPPCVVVDLKKYVKEGNEWVPSTTANVGDDVEFKIVVENIGNDISLFLTVSDDLPNFLTYNYDANHTPSSASDNHIEWEFSNLDIGEKIEIVFSAHVDSVGDDCNIGNVTTAEGSYDEDIACVEVTEEPPGELICEKKVWDKNTQSWKDETTAEIGETVRFKIKFTYYGTLAFYDIHVKDTLPTCLEYANNADPTETTAYNNIIWWNLSITLLPGESYSIEFDTLVISEGTNVNVIEVTGEQCPPGPLYCEDSATVIVEEQPGDLICEKKVWDKDTQSWKDETTAEIGETVRFNITLTYTGPYSVHSIKVKDILPACLEYANNANPTETTAYNNIIWWNLSITLLPGESYSIEFDTLVISEGTNVNVIEVTGEQCPPGPLYCEDSATVIVEEQPGDLICEKKVWDKDTQSWKDETTAEIGETVRFKIKFTYWGELSFYDFWILDTLPPCLEYANNAIPSEPSINGNELLWHPSISLASGDSYSIEFDALVISEGTNVNHVNITGIECGVRNLYCEAEATVLVCEDPEELIADANGPYSGEPEDIIYFSGTANGGIPPYTYEWDFDYNGVTFNVEATGETPSKSWSTEGVYTVALRVTDKIDTKKIDSTTISIEIPNDAPLKPAKPEGPNEGKAEKDLSFSASTTDPDGDQIWYKWSWGDGQESTWIGPHTSGEKCDVTHQFTEEGTYSVKVKAKDNNNKESSWSESLEIGIKTKTKSKGYLMNFIERLVKDHPIIEKILQFLTNFLSMIQEMQLKS